MVSPSSPLPHEPSAQGADPQAHAGTQQAHAPAPGSWVRSAALAAVFGSIALLLPAGCKPAAQAGKGNVTPAADRVQSVEVVKLERRDLSELLTVVGSLAPNESAELRAEIAGLVRSIHFEEGMSVSAGQLLLKIDDSELSALVTQSEARFRLTELNLQRSEALRATQSNTQADLDRARSEFSSAKAELAVLRLRLAKTEIKAPFDGVIGSRSVSVGDYVSTTTPITTLDDLSRLKLDFQVPERVLSKVHRGTSFVILPSTLNREENAAPIRGEVYFVSSAIDRNTRSSQVKGLLTAPDTRLKPGMFANIEVVLEQRKGVLTVPESALLTTAQGASLILVTAKGKDQVAEFTPVRVGLRTRGYAEVEALKGTLSEGTEVVASGVGGLILYPGAKLAPRPLNAKLRP